MVRQAWLAVMALAALAAGCGAQAEKKRAPRSAYADPSVCAGCHAEIAKSYRLTGMGRSISIPAPNNLIEDFSGRNTLLHRASGSTYTITLRDGAIYQRRHQAGFRGAETNVAEKRVEFVIGSGNHARSYLGRDGEGKFVEMPVTWYSARGGFWEMSPGYDRADQEDFRRVVREECLFCHSSYTEPLQAIDCQRCHGPGLDHAESSGRRPILNPKRLERDRQLEVCMQCHLETTSSPLPNAIRRAERTPLSYRPGEPLGAFNLYFDHAPGTGNDDKFEIAHAAYRLRKSACFRKSAMTCSTCHDPHKVRRAAEAARCAQCHAIPHAPGTNCIECHMPRRRTGDAVHVSMTDHFIQRRPAVGPPPPPKPYQGEVVLYYPERLPPSLENEAYLATAQVQHGSNLPAGIPRLEAAIARLAPSGPEFYFELARAYSKNGDEPSAVRWYEQALQRQPGFRPAVKGMAASLIAQRHFQRAIEVLSADRKPDAVMLANHGRALLESGNVDEAGRMLDRAAAANADLPEPHNLLGMLWLRRGNPAQAEREFREAIRLQPDLGSAHANLAGLLADRKDFAQAQFHFTKAISFDPKAADIRRNYGFLLILVRDLGRARIEFETALRLDPSRPEVRIDLAELELAAGRPDAAGKQYRLALQQSPLLAEAHLGLGALLLQQGRIAEARAHLQQAVDAGNPDVRHAALSALSSIR